MTVATYEHLLGEDIGLPAEAKLAAEPPMGLDAADYAERHIVLPHGTNARSGPYSYRAAPYSEEWLRSLSAPEVRQVTLITSTQVGKSTTLLLALCWGVACNPCPMLWVGPRGDDVGEMLRLRLAPILKGSPDLARRMTGVRSDETRKLLAFSNGAVIYTGTGRSAASLRSKPIKIAIADEVSDWPSVAKRNEGAHGLRLMKERTRTWGSEGKLILATTPTVEDEAAWREFVRSDRRRFWVPCPHCEGWQQLEESQLRWGGGDDPDAITDPHYVCRHCEARITDRQKLPAMQAGRWVPERVTIDEITGEIEEYEPSTHRGYQIGALYSPWLTWGEYIREMLVARDPSKLQAFVNLWRGLPYRPVTQRVTAAQAVARVVPSLARGSVHELAEVLTAGVDVQQKHTVWVVRAWGRDEQSWLVDHGTASTWSELMRIMTEARWPQAGRATGLPVSQMCVDMADGNRAPEVYTLAREYPHLVVPARGHDQKAIPWQMRTLTKNTKVDGAEGLRYVLWSNSWFFRKLTGAMNAPAGGRGAWWICADVDRDYLEELQGRQLQVTIRADGTQHEEWVQVGPDHYWDAECMAMVAAELCGATRLIEAGIAPQERDAPEPVEVAPMADRIREEKRRWNTGSRARGGWAIRPRR